MYKCTHLRSCCLVGTLTAILSHTVICNVSAFPTITTQNWSRNFQQRIRSQKIQITCFWYRTTYIHPPTYPNSTKRNFYAAYVNSMQTKLVSEQIKVAADRAHNRCCLSNLVTLIAHQSNSRF